MVDYHQTLLTSISSSLNVGTNIKPTLSDPTCPAPQHITGYLHTSLPHFRSPYHLVDFGSSGIGATLVAHKRHFTTIAILRHDHSPSWKLTFLRHIQTLSVSQFIRQQSTLPLQILFYLCR